MNVSARDFLFYKKPLLQSYEKNYIKKGNSRDQSHHRGGVGKISPVG
jgi:hypothetical protein